MWKLEEDRLLSLLKDFYTLSGMQIVLIDRDFREVLRYPNERIAFCTRIRQNPDMNQKCITCDQDNCARCLKSGELICYHCYAGLMEVVQPILDGSGVLGYIMFGQIIAREGCEGALSALKRMFAEAQYPGITQAIEAIPVKSQDEIHAAATILQALTGFALSKRYVSPKRSVFLLSLDTYIEQNLDKSITTEALCRHFQVSRRGLYAMAKRYLEDGLASYIRKKRLAHAKELLLRTQIPIAQIAFCCGFSDYNHFSRVFKEETGIPAR